MLAPSIVAQGRRRCSMACMSKALRQPQTARCIGCRCEYVTTPTLAKTRKYCSAECRKAHQKTRIRCEKCGQERAVTPSQPRQGARFCSWECARAILDKPRPTVTCEQCGKVCAVPPSRVRRGMRFCSHSCRSIYNIAHGKMASPTSIEPELYRALELLNVEHVAQHAVPEAGTVLDAFVPATKTALYADGDYWHSLPKVALRDQRQNRKLKEMGYTVHRFSKKIYA